MENNNIINKFEFLKTFGQNLKIIHIFGRRGRDALIVTKDDSVWTTDCDLLGVSAEAKPFRKVNELCNKGVNKFATGFVYATGGHALALTRKGQIYSWGNNSSGQLGDSTRNTCSAPKLIPLMTDKCVSDIACGECHSVVLTESGQVLTFGDNKFGQLGHNNNYIELTPKIVTALESHKIVSISSGLRHCLALTASGDVFSWGWNENGELGIGSSEHKCMPKLIKISKVNAIIDKVLCGKTHSLMLSRDGHLYSFGSNSCGQVGSDLMRKTYLLPSKISCKENSVTFADIACSNQCDMSAALTTTGDCYVWGKCNEELVRQPKLTPLKSLIEAFVCYSYPCVTFKSVDVFTQNEKFAKQFAQLFPLGSGGFGVVFKTINIADNKFYAVKQIPLKDCDICRVCRELDFLCQLKSEYVVQIVNSWFEHNYYLHSKEQLSKIKRQNSGLTQLFNPYAPLLLHIQMELCQLTLSDAIVKMKSELHTDGNARTPLAYYMASELSVEILESVNYLHKQNPQVIHRDLKPANILLCGGTGGRFVRIADFGISTTHDFADQSHTSAAGTAKYAAPEVLTGRLYDTKADIYSVGIIIHELFDTDLYNHFSNTGNSSKSNKSNSKYEPTTVSFQQRFLNSTLLALKKKNNNSLVARKHPNLCKLIEKLLSHPSERPSCDQVLADKNFWTVNLNEIRDDKEWQNIVNTKPTAKSLTDNFCHFFIQSKHIYSQFFNVL